MTENNKDIIDGRKEEENKSITLRDIFDFIVFNWYWFALSAIAFAGIGIVYAPRGPTYTAPPPWCSSTNSTTVSRTAT